MDDEHIKTPITHFQGNCKEYYASFRIIPDSNSLEIQVQNTRTLEIYRQLIDKDYTLQHQGIFKGLLQDPRSIFDYINSCFHDIVIEDGLLKFTFTEDSMEKNQEIFIKLAKQTSKHHLAVESPKEKLAIQDILKTKIKQLSSALPINPEKGQEVIKNTESQEDGKKEETNELKIQTSKKGRIGSNETVIQIQGNQSDKLTQYLQKISSAIHRATQQAQNSSIKHKHVKKITIKAKRHENGFSSSQVLNGKIEQLREQLAVKQARIKTLEEKLERVESQNILLKGDLQQERDRNNLLSEALHREEVKNSKLAQQFSEKVNELSQQLKDSEERAKKLFDQLKDQQKEEEKISQGEKAIIKNYIAHHPRNSHQAYYHMTCTGESSLKLNRTGKNGYYNFVNRFGIHPGQKAKYSVKVSKATNNWALIGFCTEKGLGNMNNFNHVESFYYYCYNIGYLFEGGSRREINVSAVNGEVIESVADLVNGRISWLKNGHQFAECIVPVELSSKTLFLSILLFSKDDEIDLYV